MNIRTSIQVNTGHLQCAQGLSTFATSERYQFDKLFISFFLSLSRSESARSNDTPTFTASSLYRQYSWLLITITPVTTLVTGALKRTAGHPRTVLGNPIVSFQQKNDRQACSLLIWDKDDCIIEVDGVYNVNVRNSNLECNTMIRRPS